MFVLEARYAGMARQIGWDDGQLSGDPLLVRAVQDAALEAVGRALGPVGGRTPLRTIWPLASHLGNWFGSWPEAGSGWLPGRLR